MSGYEAGAAQRHLDELEDELERLRDEKRMTAAGFTDPEHFHEWERLEQIRRAEALLTRERLDCVGELVDGSLHATDRRLHVALPCSASCAAGLAAGSVRVVDRRVVPAHESSPSVRDAEVASSASSGPTVGGTADTSRPVSPSGAVEAGGAAGEAADASPAAIHDDDLADALERIHRLGFLR